MFLLYCNLVNSYYFYFNFNESKKNPKILFHYNYWVKI